MPKTKRKPDLMQWKRSEHLARRIVQRYLTSMGGEENGHVIAPPEESLITLIALAIARARLEPQASAVRSAARSASRSVTTRRRALRATRSTKKTTKTKRKR